LGCGLVPSASATFAGAPAKVALADGTRPHPKGRTTLPPGARLVMHYGGGGGVGDPRERDRAALKRDIEAGYVTAEGAKRDYGGEG
jgi:N-methylhydantoinase B